ncbi:hypothetical protein G6F43_012455 [Rhizopus delemar]|nr:hypothetical protein G6F43_012455 [Rhizopus delemar]
MHLDCPFFSSELLQERERRDIIDSYPAMRDAEYQTPDTIPMATRNIKKFPAKLKHDVSLKRLQYLVSGIFRPLDVLALEISRDHHNPNVQRYLEMLADARLLLLNLSAQMNEMRNTLAFQAMNPSFTSPNNSTDNNNYTMSLTDFQAALAQQTTAFQTYNKATYANKKPRFNQQPQFQQRSSFNHTPPNQFFRPGPSSQQGGYNQQSNFQFKPNSHNNRSNNNDRSTNLFRNNQQQ